ncbi:MAG: aminodeoxychorismate/anthranilate synthase component II [Clostridia bacterium]
MILLIDNYDSFSYNVYQLIGSFRPDIKVIRNDEMTVLEIEKENFDAIFLSPGPKHPKDAGVCIEVVQKLSGKVPIFGICLGHQAICEAFGGVVSYASKLMHGKTSNTTLNKNSRIFKDMDENITVARYHSLSAVEKNLPDCLEIIARSDDGDIMAVAHKERKVYGVQFHPESVLTPKGHMIIKNFLEDI